MKKSYISPAMESELFVANEYCAVCFKVYCADSSHNQIKQGNYKYTNDVVGGTAAIEAGAHLGTRGSGDANCNGEDPNRFYHHVQGNITCEVFVEKLDSPNASN